MLMKKMILYVVSAVALIALNVAAFSSNAAHQPGTPQPPVHYVCNQYYSYCKEGGTVVMRPNCSMNNVTNGKCEQEFCEKCWNIPEPWVVVRDERDLGK